MNQEEIKEFNKKVSSLKGTNPAQIIYELEQAEPPQSEINHVVLDQIVRQQEELDRQSDEIKRLKEALEAIWPFIEEDFPNGINENHGTCSTDEYVKACKLVEQALKKETK